MDFYCISTSHQNANIDVRERFSFSQHNIKESLKFYKENNQQFLGPKSEIVILSTCNRFEIYVTFRGDQHEFLDDSKKVFQTMLMFVSEITDLSIDDIAPLFIRYQNMDTVEHLFRVSCGLESQVLGEVQILGQVSEALSVALEVGSARHPLASLFQSAIHAAKRAHTETEIGKKPTSISSAAVRIAEKWLKHHRNQMVLVIGAGEMSKLALKSFNQRDFKNLTIVNRTYTKAVDLAEQFSFRVAPFEELENLLLTADIVITATSVEHPIITLELLNPILKHRKNSTILFLDIALPRNVDSAIRNLSGVELIDLDDLKLRLDETKQHREQEAKQVEEILKEEVRNYSHWVEVMPTVGKLHRKAEMIRRHELEKMIQHTPDLDPHLQEKIDLLTRSLVKKILHEPSTKMRMETTNKEMNLYTNTLHYLFGLDEDMYAYPIDMEQPKND
ncbi:MAG: glutamyl-tRNA reductase [Chloroflexi bacterium HGW-Chloroflexi-3]|nr:MAG: glutamyl-tRNA reductase [Chloroflexi bacterium HGW-Chloroflexi-3]